MDPHALTNMFKALSNPNRFRLFEEIREGGKAAIKDGHGCVLNHVIERLGVGAPTVSHHLKELVNAGLVATEKHGRFLHCRVNDDAIASLKRYFSHSGAPSATTPS